MVDKVAVWQGFLTDLRSSSVSIFLPRLHSYLQLNAAKELLEGKAGDVRNLKQSSALSDTGEHVTEKYLLFFHTGSWFACDLQTNAYLWSYHEIMQAESRRRAKSWKY